MFFSKLRPTDSFGLVTFNNQAQVLIKTSKVANIKFEAVSAIVKGIHPRGGTTIMSGFEAAN